MNKIFSAGISIIVFLVVAANISAADLTGKRIYINPGHGSWGSDDRPCATIPYPNLTTSGMPDTLGFYESNTNLWKCLYLGNKLEEAGATVLYSRKANGPWDYEMVNGDYPTYDKSAYLKRSDYRKYNKSLTVVCAEVEANNIDYFISVHSNALDGTDGDLVNYPLYLYRGPNSYSTANTTNNYAYVPGSYEKASTSWDYCNEIMLSGINPSTAYKTSKYIVGDQDFYANPYDSQNSHSGKTYYGYLGALKHGASGFLVEGYFHSYQPARHRALNPDYCTMEGLAYYRGIVDYYDADTEANGYIMGAIRTKSATMNNSLYTYISKSNDQYQPINGAKVVLRNSKGTLIYCNCYPYVARELKNQPYYTTDNNWNGIFTYKNLTPGTYYLSVHKEGYADYYSTIEVTANKTTYLNIFMEVGTGTEPNTTNTIQLDQPSYLELPDLFEMQQSYVNQTIDEALNGKTIRRAIYGDGVMYVLAVDNIGTPTLLEVDTDTHLVLATLPTNHCTANGANGLPLSDIALTTDGVLIGCNMEAVTYTPSNKWKLYKWHKNNSGSWTGSLWLSHANNETAGNYNNALVGGTFAYEGLSHSGTIVTIARNTGSNNDIRFVIYQIDGNNVKTVIRNHPSDVSVNTYGDKIQLNKSPFGDNRFIFTSSTMNGFEWQISNTTALAPTVHAQNIIHSYGANYFVYANHTLMVTPSMANGQNTGVVVFDITDGWANAPLVRTTNTTLEATTPSYSMAAAQVDSLDLTLYLLKDQTLSKFTTSGVVQPIVPHINAYNLTAKHNKEIITFSFTANTAAQSASIIFYDKTTNNEIGRQSIDVVKGHNEISIHIQDLPGSHGQEITWAIDLHGLAISNWNKIYSTKEYNFTRPFIAINNNPESKYFQYLYISERTGNATTGNGLYVFTPDYTRVNNSPYRGGRTTIGSPYTCAIDDQGYIWLSDGSDQHSGIFIANPDNPHGIHEQFFHGNRNTATGLITNGEMEVGSSCTGLSIYGNGENTQLLAINEDAGTTLASNSLSVYHIGNNDGTYIHSWSSTPTKNIDLPGVGTYYAYPLGCSHGFWITLRRSNGNNSSDNAALQFFDWEGNRKMCSAEAPYSQLINGSYSGACTMNSDESVLYFVDATGHIMVWDIQWAADYTPKMSLRYSYPTGLTDIREMHFDYAGNLVCSGDDEDITIFSIPSAINHTLIPASSTQSVAKNYIAPKSITLSEQNIQLKVDSTFSLSANILPNNVSNPNIIWSSANTNIATVENGVVTAHNKGQTTIYAIAEDDIYVLDSCSVWVYAYMNDAEARRIWAYDLNLTEQTGTYTFNFKAITAANQAYILFYNNDGEEIGRYPLDNVVKGQNTFTLLQCDIAAYQNQVHWALELHADPIKNIVEITSADEDKFYYYLPQGVAINNNPLSEHFGKIYVAEPYAGANDGKTTHSQTQTKGIYVYDPLLNIENYASGYVPSNVTFNDSHRYQQLHRIAINPLTDAVTFVQSAGANVWTIDASALKDETAADNLLANIKNISYSQSLCFDEEGVLYILDADATTDSGALYKITNGNANILAQSNKWGNDRNSIVSDGRGGIWLTQYRAQLDTYDMLSHIAANGEIDFNANINSDTQIKMLLPTNTARGHIAYYAQQDILALGGDGTVILYKVNYDMDGKPSLTKWLTTPTLGSNIDGIAFDYAGDLVALSASVERFYKFTLPTENNSITIPAQTYYINNPSTGNPTKWDKDNIPTKLLHNGMIYILRNGEIYTIQGTKLK